MQWPMSIESLLHLEVVEVGKPGEVLWFSRTSSRNEQVPAGMKQLSNAKAITWRRKGYSTLVYLTNSSQTSNSSEHTSSSSPIRPVLE